MLIWMRNSAFAGVFKFALMGLLLLAVGGMVFMDRYGSAAMGSTSNTIVKGDGIHITAPEFDRLVRRAIQQQGIGTAEAYKLGMINNILTGEIQNRLFTNKARSLGLEVSDESVKKQIAKLAEPLATDGRSKKQALQQLLRQQGISETEFVGSIRQEMANTLLRAVLQPPASLQSPLMAQSLYRYDHEKRAIKAIYLKNANAPELAKPTDEQLQKYYEANKQSYLIPETRTITMATLKADMVKKDIKITDEQLKADYDKNIASFTKPPSRLVEQAALKTEDEAKKAVEEIKAGKAMKDVVPADTYNAPAEYAEKGLLPEIGTPVFTAKKGDVLGPIKTDLGYHVLVIKDILPETIQPLDQVKEKLRAELENIAQAEQLSQAGNAIEDRVAGGATLDEIVKEYGMTTEIIGPFRQTGFDKDAKDLFKSFGSDRDTLVQTAFDYEEGEIASAVETGDGQLHFIHIDKVIPDSYRDFASVKSELETKWMNEQKKLTNKGRASAALDALNNGKSIQDVAVQDNATVDSYDNINRKDTPPAPLNPVVAAQVFTTPVGQNFSAEVDGGFIVGKVEKVTLPENVKADEKDIKDLEDLTGRSLAQDVFGLYVRGLTKDNEIKINQQRIDQLYAKTQE